MRVVFMGTPDFAVPVLETLIRDHTVVAVYCQPPRPAGRGHHDRPSPVQRLAEQENLAVHVPKSLKGAAAQEAFAALGADVAVVAAYGLILPTPILAAPRLGCVNVHASLLPRWRGAAPIQRAILAGDAESGVCLMQMEAGLDTGPVFACRRVAIDAATNAGDLHDTLATLGAGLVHDYLPKIAAGEARAEPQPEDGVTFAAKIERVETRLRWDQDANAVVRQINAFAPVPGAWSELDRQRIKVLAASAVEATGSPGEVVGGDLVVACGRGAIRIETLQLAGRRPLTAAQFLRGQDLAVGTVLR